MATLLVGNCDPDATDDEIREMIVRYGFPPFDTIRHVEGSGSRPAVLLDFDDFSPESLRALQPRIHNLFWKNRTLHVQVMTERNP